MNLSRRSLLTGLLSSAAVIAAGPVAKITSPIPVGREYPWWEHWETQQAQFLEGMAQRAVQTFIYGNPEILPRQFTGLTPFYDAKRTGNVLDGGLDDPRALDWKMHWAKQA